MLPELDVYDLPGDVSPEQAEHLIEKHNIGYIVLDRWSAHQPKWALSYFLPDNGYHPVFITENLLILTVNDRTGHKARRESRLKPLAF